MSEWLRLLIVLFIIISATGTAIIYRTWYESKKQYREYKKQSERFIKGFIEGFNEYKK